MSKFWNQRSKKLPMKKAEEKPRESNDINTEYTQVCARIGQLQYNIKSMEASMQMLYNRIEELTDESNKRQLLDAAKQQEVKDAEAGLQ